MPVQADATQWTDRARGRNLDQSVLAANFFGAPLRPVAVFTSAGRASLADLAKNTLHNGVATILRLTAERSPGAMFTERMATYLNGVFAADKEKVPAGITVYHPNGNGAEPFNSHGDQTLLGLSLAFKCQPAGDRSAHRGEVTRRDVQRGHGPVPGRRFRPARHQGARGNSPVLREVSVPAGMSVQAPRLPRTSRGA